MVFMSHAIRYTSRDRQQLEQRPRVSKRVRKITVTGKEGRKQAEMDGTDSRRDGQGRKEQTNRNGRNKSRRYGSRTVEMTKTIVMKKLNNINRNG